MLNIIFVYITEMLQKDKNRNKNYKDYKGMRAKGSMRRCSRRRKPEKTLQPLRSFMMITACAFTAIVVAVGSQVIDNSEKGPGLCGGRIGRRRGKVRVGKPGSIFAHRDCRRGFRCSETPSPGSTVNRIGTSCEQVMVGQRVKKVEENVTEFNISSSMEATVDHLEAAATDLSSTPKMMSDAITIHFFPLLRRRPAAKI